MDENRKYILQVMETIGFNTEGKSFERCVDLLLQEHIRILQEIEGTNKDTFKREINRLISKPTN